MQEQLPTGTETGKLEFLNKRICGAWMIWIGIVSLAGLLTGGTQLILMPVFSFGYAIGVFGILNNKKAYRLLSYGSPTAFQNRMTLISIIAMLVMMVLIGGPHFQDENYRMIWLGAFLATGIHFVPMVWVHGRSMIIIAILLSVNALVGIMDDSISFHMLAYIDLVIKVVFGLYLLLWSKPSSINIRRKTSASNAT